jgi:hypothetical protein
MLIFCCTSKFESFYHLKSEADSKLPALKPVKKNGYTQQEKSSTTQLLTVPIAAETNFIRAKSVGPFSACKSVSLIDDQPKSSSTSISSIPAHKLARIAKKILPNRNIRNWERYEVEVPFLNPPSCLSGNCEAGVHQLNR